MNHPLFQLHPGNIEDLETVKNFAKNQFGSIGFQEAFCDLETKDSIKCLALAAHFAAVCRNTFTVKGDPGVNDSTIMTQFVIMAKVTLGTFLF